VTKRFDFGKTAPEPFGLLRQMNDYCKATVDPTLLELVKLRSSVLNGCAYCVDMHGTDALRGGEHVQRLLAVSAWRESTFFTDSERVALELTDTLTRLGEHGLPDELWQRARAFWTEKEIADLISAIIMINGFNRVAISSRMEATLRDDLQPPKSGS
jgi:AhpD family alkylhydroperoxidase